jgi:hypothetical protein
VNRCPSPVPVSREQPLPATLTQEWALQLEGVEKNSIPFALRFDGPLDLAALRRSLTEIVRRHEALRTSFRWESGEAHLVIALAAELPVPVIDLAALPPERRLGIRDRLIAGHADHEFDMARGPLFLAQVVRLDARDHALLLNVHHIISDGWSIRVITSEMTALYAAFAEGRSAPLSPLPIQFTDFAWWQRRVFGGEPLAAQLAWWRRTLAHLPPPPPLPSDLPRPEVVGMLPVHGSVWLAPEPAQSLRAFARETKCSLPMVLLAAAGALLHAWNGQEDLIVSLIFAGRTRPELWDQIGLFMNTLALRVDLSGNPSFRKLAERVSDATLEAYLHQDVPFPRVLQELFPGRQLTRTLLSGVCFNMLTFSEAADTPAGGEALPEGLTLHAIPGDEGETKHDLVFTGAEEEGAVLFDLMGSADLFTPGRINAMARDFEALLARVAADPDVPLDRLRELVQDAQRATTRVAPTPTTGQ